MTHSLIFDFFVFFLGTMVGSFLNVCIYRLPREESVIWPPSHCPQCQGRIPWYLNVPVFSYFMLNGKCRSCQAKISFQYPAVEFTTGVFFLSIWLFMGWSYQSAIATVLFCALFVATVVDFQHQIIPDEISLGGLALGLLISPFVPVLHGQSLWWKSLLESFLGALAGGGMIYLTGVIGDFVFRKESMGGGDVKLLAMLGAFLGWKKVILVYLLAPVLALPFGLYFKFFKKASVIPYGPFLSVAGWVSFLWGEQLINWYLNGMIGY